MTAFRRVAPVAILSLLTTRPLLAESPGTSASPEPEDQHLAALVEEALAKNPDLLAVQEALAAARERPDQARSLADPMVSVAYTNDGWSPSLGERDMTTLALMGSQVLPWPGKRRLRGEIASLEADVIAPRIERVKLGLTAAVKRAYWSLVLARELKRLIDEQEETWKEIEGVARARYAVGQGAQQDVLRVQVEQTRIAQLQAEQQAEAEVRRAELNRLLARSGDQPFESTGHLALRSDARSAEERLAGAEAASPELRASAVAIDRDRLAASLARKDFRPDFTVQAGYMNRGRLDPMWQAGVGDHLADLPQAPRERPCGGGGPLAGERAPARVHTPPAALPHPGAARPAAHRGHRGPPLRRRHRPAGPDVGRGRDRELPGGKSPVHLRARGTVDALRRPFDPPARPGQPRAHPGQPRRGQPRGHLGNAGGRRWPVLGLGAGAAGATSTAGAMAAGGMGK